MKKVLSGRTSAGVITSVDAALERVRVGGRGYSSERSVCARVGAALRGRA